MIECKQEGGALLVRVRAQPGASRDKIVGEHAGALKVAVTQPPERGRANDAISKLLAKKLDIRPSAVTLVSGESSRDKVFRIEGVSEQNVEALAKR